MTLGFFFLLVGQREQRAGDRHRDPQELVYVRGVFGLPKPMDLHYPTFELLISMLFNPLERV